MWTALRANWKTTLSGFASFAIAAIFAIHFDAAGKLQMTQRDWFILAAGLIKAVVGMLMQDAGTVTAVTASGAVAAVPAHETPNDPANTPVAQ